MKRNRTISSYFTHAPNPVIRSSQSPPRTQGIEPEPEPEIEPVEIGASNLQQTIPNSVPNANGVVADPGLRIPIEELDPNIRDAAKREYILMGPYQPKGHNYPQRIICGRNQRFQDDWFKNHPWL